MSNTPQQIAAQIEAHMGKHRKPYSAWYVGIAASPERRLFNDHSVDQRNGGWIYSGAGNTRAARSVENHFVNKGCKGGGGGGDHTTTYVYAYLITPKTRE